MNLSYLSVSFLLLLNTGCASTDSAASMRVDGSMVGSKSATGEEKVASFDAHETSTVSTPSVLSKTSRSMDEIKLVFDRTSPAIYSSYARAFQRNQDLVGRIVFQLHIAPSGIVTAGRVVSSELRAPDLEVELLELLRSLNFGTREVAPIDVTFPISFDR